MCIRDSALTLVVRIPGHLFRKAKQRCTSLRCAAIGKWPLSLQNSFCNDKGTTCLAPYATQFDGSPGISRPKLPQNFAKHKNAQHHSLKKSSVQLTWLPDFPRTMKCGSYAPWNPSLGSRRFNIPWVPGRQRMASMRYILQGYFAIAVISSVVYKLYWCCLQRYGCTCNFVSVV